MVPLDEDISEPQDNAATVTMPASPASDPQGDGCEPSIAQDDDGFQVDLTVSLTVALTLNLALSVTLVRVRVRLNLKLSFECDSG